MQFGKAIGTACTSFILTNIDDLFVLVTFFAEASTSDTLTPLKIAIGQYLGFSVIIAISMIGFGLALVIPAEPIGFLGLLPILLGIWKLIDLLLSNEAEEDEEIGVEGRGRKSKIVLIQTIGKVALITIMNGGDNISTYIPLFSQAKGAEVAVYVVVYYLMLGTWLLAAFLIMKQRHILRIAQKYSGYLIPFLYMGLGIFIIVNSECYPWSIEQIDDDIETYPGKAILGSMTAFVLVACTITMVWTELRKRGTKEDPDMDNAELEEDALDGATIVQSPSKVDTSGMPKQAVGGSAAVSRDDVTRPGSSRAAPSSDDITMPESSTAEVSKDHIMTRA